jgi:hypothetical protein
MQEPQIRKISTYQSRNIEWLIRLRSVAVCPFASLCGPQIVKTMGGTDEADRLLKSQILRIVTGTYRRKSYRCTPCRFSTMESHACVNSQHPLLKQSIPQLTLKELWTSWRQGLLKNWSTLSMNRGNDFRLSFWDVAEWYFYRENQARRRMDIQS